MVEPLYQINLGYAARICRNFGVEELVLVRPRCKVDGKQAIKYAKHAYRFLGEARVVSGIGTAIQGTFSIGTTGIWRKSRNSFRNIFYPAEIAAMARKNGIRSISIVMGRDDTGLSAEEMHSFDAISFIPAMDDYSVLNISHALAIMLYEFTKGDADNRYGLGRFRATEAETEALVRSFEKGLAQNKRVRNKKAVASAMKHLLVRAGPTKKEINALHAAFSLEKEKNAE